MSLVLKALGLGRIPAGERRAVLADGAEGEALIIENAWVVVGLTRFRAPGRYVSRRKRLMWGALVVTERRLAAWVGGRRMVNVPLGPDRPPGLAIDRPKPNRLRLAFEAGQFVDRASGRVELIFRTDRAGRIMARL